ncbi:MAG: type 4a pilus biogenesis protein PilO [Candidatus Gottesmanbacteria bacterium]|nr:type 4a pilus biogenesis protein PilO [Candidatus Gottesmanbacteria bacterium]
MAFDYKEEYKRYKRYYQSLEPALQKPATRAYTAIIFSFLVVSLFGWYAIRPTMQTIFTLRREIADKTDLNKKMEDKISALIEAQAAYQEVEPDLPVVDQALPETSDAVRAARDLQAIAADSRVTITTISISSLPLTNDTGQGEQQATGSDKLANFPISLSVTGAYPDIKTFTLGILNVRRIMQITSMLFSPISSTEAVASGSATPTGTQIKLDLKLKLFYLSK